MSARLSIGLTRQVGDGGPAGHTASIHIELDIEPALANDSSHLQERIRGLLATAQASLANEPGGKDGRPAASAAASNGNATSTPARTPRSATQSQVKALFAIARSQKIDLSMFLQEQFQVQRPGDLTIQEASQAIDALKAAPAGKGG